MPTRTPLPRRMLLRGMLGGAAVGIGLPLLETFLNSTATAHADGSPLPRRFGWFFWGNGVRPELWVPEGTGPDWALSPLLAPLAAVKSAVSVVSGMKLQTGSDVPHGSGAVGILAGAPFANGDSTTFPVATIDQVIAKEIGGTTRFRSLEIGVERSSKSQSFNGPHSTNPQETSPLVLFQRIFGGEFTLPGAPPPEDPRLALRHSVLDVVAGDITRLQARLGAADKARLDQHLTGVRRLEKQLVPPPAMPSPLAACAVPSQPAADYSDTASLSGLSATSRALADVMAMALACDQTRVFSHLFSILGSNGLLYPGVFGGHHQLTHDEPEPQPQVQSIVTFIITELAYFLGALAAIKEGDGTLLDHCAILATTDSSLARIHRIDEYPILVAGGGSGSLKQGVHYRSATEESPSKVLLTLARASGLTLDSYGQDTGLATESVSAIET